MLHSRFKSKWRWTSWSELSRYSKSWMIRSWQDPSRQEIKPFGGRHGERQPPYFEYVVCQKLFTKKAIQSMTIGADQRFADRRQGIGEKLLRQRLGPITRECQVANFDFDCRIVANQPKPEIAGPVDRPLVNDCVFQGQRHGPVRPGHRHPIPLIGPQG